MLIKMKTMMKEGKVYNLVKEHNQTVSSNRRAEKWARIESIIMNLAVVVGTAFVAWMGYQVIIYFI